MDVVEVRLDPAKISRCVRPPAWVKKSAAMAGYSLARETGLVLEREDPRFSGMCEHLAAAKLYAMGGTSYITAISLLAEELQAYFARGERFYSQLNDAVKVRHGEAAQHWARIIAGYWIDLYGHHGAPFTLAKADASYTFESIPLSYELPPLPFPAIFVGFFEDDADPTTLGTASVLAIDLDPAYSVVLYGVLLLPTRSYYFSMLLPKAIENSMDSLTAIDTWKKQGKMAVQTVDHYPENFDQEYYQRIFRVNFNENLEKKHVSPIIHNGLDLYFRDLVGQYSGFAMHNKLSRFDVRKLKRSTNNPYIPADYYTLVVKEEANQASVKRTFTRLTERHLHYRPEQRSYFKLRLFRGKLPLPKDKAERFSRLRYQVFTTSEPGEDLIQALERRKIPMKRTDEWMAMKLSPVSVAVPGSKALPAPSATRFLLEKRPKNMIEREPFE